MIESKSLEVLMIDLGLPPAELSPNSRCHWAVKAKAVKRYRRSAGVIARARLGRAKAPRWRRAQVLAVFFLPDGRVRDPDNLMACLKPAWDGLVDAGILADDRGLVILPPILKRATDEDGPGVRIVVNETTL